MTKTVLTVRNKLNWDSLNISKELKDYFNIYQHVVTSITETNPVTLKKCTNIGHFKNLF
jgi:hypothetical protein